MHPRQASALMEIRAVMARLAAAEPAPLTGPTKDGRKEKTAIEGLVRYVDRVVAAPPWKR